MRRGIIAALFTTAVGVSACAYYNDYAIAAPADGPWQYRGTAFRAASGALHFAGSGAGLLDPWLAETPDGRRLVNTRFDARQDGHLSAETARHANRWFRSRADTNRDLSISDDEIRRALDALSI